MCDPVTIGIVGTVASAAGQFIGMQQQSSQAEAQQRAARQNYDQQRAYTDQANVDRLNADLEAQKERLDAQRRISEQQTSEQQRQRDLENQAQQQAQNAREIYKPDTFEAAKEQRINELQGQAAQNRVNTGDYLPGSGAPGVPKLVTDTIRQKSKDAADDVSMVGRALFASTAPLDVLQAGAFGLNRAGDIIKATGNFAKGSQIANQAEENAVKAGAAIRTSGITTPNRDIPQGVVPNSGGSSMVGDFLSGVGQFGSDNASKIAKWFSPTPAGTYGSGGLNSGMGTGSTLILGSTGRLGGGV